MILAFWVKRHALLSLAAEIDVRRSSKGDERRGRNIIICHMFICTRPGLKYKLYQQGSTVV
jgi:hypothetical protein